MLYRGKDPPTDAEVIHSLSGVVGPIPSSNFRSRPLTASEQSVTRDPSVQSLKRAFDLLELMAAAGGEMGISELAQASGLPHPTIHRLLRTLVDLGYVRQRSSRRYALGVRLVGLGEKARYILTVWARPSLARLVDETGETANLSLLEGDELVYLAQVPSQKQMRMWIEVGLRVLPHSTGAGKALLAQLPGAKAREIVERTGLPTRTPRTITDADALMAELEIVRRRGYAVDDEEHELGVRCIAVAITNAPAPIALSVSGPASRLDANAELVVATKMIAVATDFSRSLDNANSRL